MARCYYFLCLELDACMAVIHAWQHNATMSVLFSVLACCVAAILAFEPKR